jgi:hypothetical protein
MPPDARPSLLADPVMGLVPDRAGAPALLAAHRHVYFSDLRGLAVPRDRVLYGCFVDGAVTANAICCAGAGDPPLEPDVRRAIDDGTRGEWDRTWALLEQPVALAPAVVEHLLALGALGMLDPRIEVRLRALTRVGRFLREHPALVPADTREVASAFLLYRAADASDLVYYDAVALIDELKLPPGVVEHVMARGRSADPRERVEALVARRRMHAAVYSFDPPFPPLAALLDDGDPEVQLALLQLLGQVARFSWDTDDLLPGVDVAGKLDRLLRSRDDRVRGTAIRYARGAGKATNGPALRAALADPDPALRDAALDALYVLLPPDELRELLLHHEASPSQRAAVRAAEAHRRDTEIPSQIADAGELRTMLASTDPRQRHAALLLIGYTGDPALAPDVEAARHDADPRVRAEAERLQR